MKIQTERLTVRTVKETDWKSLKDILVDFQSSAYAVYDRPHDTDDESIQARTARWAAADDGVNHLFFAVCREQTVIGYCAFHNRGRCYEIGYCFHSAYHGRGYAKESLSALFAALREKGITQFTAGTALANTPSVALLKALGFRQTGTERVSFARDASGREIVFDGGIFELSTER